MRLNKRYRPLLLLLFGLLAFGARAQSGSLSAVVTVIADGVYLQRSGTVTELPLAAGAVAPLGAGDRVRTQDNGRVIIAFPDVNRLYLLPDSSYELREFTAADDGQYHVEGYLEGIAIQQFEQDAAAWRYALVTDALTVVEPADLFAVWAVAGRLEAVISAEGTALVHQTEQDAPVSIPPGTGLFAPFGEAPIMLEPPYHAAQLLSLSIECEGAVSTGGSEGLRLRRGAALDYPVVEALRDGQQIWIVGTTDNGLWYRIPYQTGFGWLYSSLITADCPDLPRFPNLVGEANEEIRRVTEPELELLEPFYGLPLTNPTFYR